MSLLRAALTILRDALIVAFLALLALTLAYQVRARLVIDLGHAHDDFFVERFFAAETDGAQTYRWTQRTAQVNLTGQSLAAPWTLRVRLNGFRPNRAARIQFAVNETPLQEFQAPGAWDIYEFTGNVSSAVWTGNTQLQISSDTFVPQNFDANNPDTRRLGILIDWMEWIPQRTATSIGNENYWIDFGQLPIMPPLAIVSSWAAALGILYATARGIGLSARRVNVAFAGLVVLLALGFAFWRAYLATYTNTFFNLALALAALAVWLMWLLPRIAARVNVPLDARSRAVLCGIVLLSIGLKWGGVWYPQFESSDLLFHAHRLGNIARGELFFTSELPDAARRVVPYPPALYVTLAPFLPFVPDFQTLLLTANVLFDGIAILGFYFAAQILFENRKSKLVPNEGEGFENRKFNLALFATFLFAFNPVTFWIYSWGNHTNIFGQTAATLLFCVLLTIHPVRNERRFVPDGEQECYGERSLHPVRNERRFVPDSEQECYGEQERYGERSLLALFMFLLASLAHLGVFLSLLAFFPLAILLRFFARDKFAKRESMMLALVFGVGVTIALLVYYADFAEILFAQTQTFLNDFGAGRAAARDGVTLKRVSDVLRYTWEQLGWVLLLGGVVGIPLAWKNFAARPRSLWLAWLITGLLFGVVTIGASFSTRYTLWAAPALALSASLALLWLYEKSRAARVLAYALCACAFAQTLWVWIERVLNAYQ